MDGQPPAGMDDFFGTAARPPVPVAPPPVAPSARVAPPVPSPAPPPVAPAVVAPVSVPVPVAAVPVAPVAVAPVPVTPVPIAPAPAPVAPAPRVPGLPTTAVAPEQMRIGAEDSSAESGFLAAMLTELVACGGSDLHLTAGAPPMVRLRGELAPVPGAERLLPEALRKTVYAMLNGKQRERFESSLELDFAYSLPGQARFRVNVFRQRDAVGAVFRVIPHEIRRLEDLGVPPAVAQFASLPRGFVLVTGPTGSGKSTTLAAVVDLANRTRADHIMTVEDPIEFLHRHQRCLVNQREVGVDTLSFASALKHVLRQDPDIILVGELRDLETISVALTAAETGHLVLGTLHTQDAAQTIDRIIDVFPAEQQQQVRVQLAGALQGVVCQQLVGTADGRGRAVAAEVLVATPAIRNLVREGKTHQIYSALQAGAKHGMSTMDSHLASLVRTGRVTYDTARESCHQVEDFNRLCGRA